MKLPHAGEQVGVAVAMVGVEQSARQHRQAVAQARSALRVAGVGLRLRMQRQKDAAQPRVATDRQQVDAAVLEDSER